MYGGLIADIKAHCILRARPLTALGTMNNYASAPSFSLAFGRNPYTDLFLLFIRNSDLIDWG